MMDEFAEMKSNEAECWDLFVRFQLKEESWSIDVFNENAVQRLGMWIYHVCRTRVTQKQTLSRIIITFLYLSIYVATLSDMTTFQNEKWDKSPWGG